MQSHPRMPRGNCQVKWRSLAGRAYLAARIVESVGGWSLIAEIEVAYGDDGEDYGVEPEEECDVWCVMCDV
jgi:hypothetical protein